MHVSMHSFTCRHKATAPGLHRHTHTWCTVRAVERVVVPCARRARGRCVCVWSAGAIFRASGIDADRRVQRSASNAPVPKGTPSAKLGPHLPRACTRTFRCGPPSVLGRVFAGIPERLCSRTVLFPVSMKERKPPQLSERGPESS